MPIKLGNNASAHLAAPLAADGTTIVLVEAEAATFPSLAAGEWFPLTLVDPAGNVEIARVTGRSANILTATRAQEGTSARSFIAGDRAEIRLTAGVIDAMRNEWTDDIAATRSTIETNTAANLDTAKTELQGSIATNRSQIEANTASNLAVALSALIPVGFGPVPWSGPDEPAGWVFADGRTLTSATSYPALRAYYIAKSFPHGQDGSGNPKIPDMRGRTAAGVDGTAGRLTGATLGATLGTQTHALATTEMPAHSHGVTDPGHGHVASDAGHSHGAWQDDHSHTLTGIAMDRSAAGYYLTTTSGGYVSRVALYPGGTTTNTGTTSGANTGGVYVGTGSASVSVASNATGITTQNAGAGAAHNNVQPTLVTNFIVKAT